jgi:anti-sigma factor RsiW
MPCDQIAAEGLAERYLLGQLSEQHQAAFERHYFDCERCFGELQTLGAMRAELRGAAARPGPHRVPTDAPPGGTPAGNVVIDAASASVPFDLTTLRLAMNDAGSHSSVSIASTL